MNKKVLVTGGSGFLGINLIRYLLRQGVTDITVLDLVEFDYPERDRIKAVQGDIRNAKTVGELMKGVHWVIHTAAALPLYTKEEIFSTDIEGTRILLAAAGKEKVERFVHISSTAVYGIPDHHPLKEGRMTCTTGHDPHGEDPKKPKKLSVARLNDACAQCHREQTRPHVYEHQAVREGCTTCHNIHGSINPKMLTERDNTLCLKCHV